MRQMNQRKETGQIGMVVLLIMSGLLTVGVSAVNRSTSDLRITRQEAESSAVFNAAEAGIEMALSDVADGSFSPTGDLSSEFVDQGIEVNYVISAEANFDMRILEGETVSLDTTGGGTNSININWAEETSCSGIVVMLYNQSTNTVRRIGYTHSSCGGIQNFISSAGGVSVPLSNGDNLVRIRAVGGDVTVQVSGAGWSLPQQYFKITSTASRTESGETKVVEVRKSLPAAPSILDYALFSGTTITK